MTTKVLFSVIVLALIALGGWYFFLRSNDASSKNEAATADAFATSAVTPGTYVVDPAKSTVSWRAKKPLIEGYINSGTIGVTEGSITVLDTEARGSFTIDINTLNVGLTAKKPGKEGALEEHLKSDDFFDVTKYPTATFSIKEVVPGPDSPTTLVYSIRGDLTMKGRTNEISFPAHIFLKEEALHAEAAFEIDRTKWDLTYGSGNFFQNLGDNLIDDMVALSFEIVAAPTK